eukprot:scaffold12292_cov112-Isochrysis_galbana.AAC.6
MVKSDHVQCPNFCEKGCSCSRHTTAQRRLSPNAQHSALSTHRPAPSAGRTWSRMPVSLPVPSCQAAASRVLGLHSHQCHAEVARQASALSPIRRLHSPSPPVPSGWKCRWACSRAGDARNARSCCIVWVCGWCPRSGTGAGACGWLCSCA